MPRCSRIKSSTGIYHVMERGNEKANIFRDREDKIKFIDILKLNKKKRNFHVYAYCLMNNHIHIIINENNNDIGEIMKSINVSYVSYFNKKYNRVGHLFQDRFKSEPVEDDKYLLSVVRYVHQNPVKGKLASRMIDYPWSSYIEYIAPEKSEFILCDTETIMDYFLINGKRSIKFFEKFMNQTSRKKHLDIIDREDAIKHHLHTKSDAHEFLKKVYLDNDIRRDELILQKTKEGSLLYEVILYLKNNSNLTYSEIADMIGISKTSVSRVK